MTVARRCAPWLALALLACESPVSSATASIAGGTPALDEPAVLVLLRADGMCTATLISPSVVLTAKHCVQNPDAEGPLAPSDIVVGVGDRVDATLREHTVRDVETTPGSYPSGLHFSRPGLDGVDVAVLVLDEPITDVEPIPIRRDRPGDVAGQTFTAVGFGERPDHGLSEKYTTTGTIESLAGTTFVTSAVACPGDSGGPMIQEGTERRVIGVASTAATAEDGHVPCPPTANTYNALFGQIDMIDRALVTAGDCLGEDERCDSLDDDCDGTIDEGCAPLGAACAVDTDCAFAQLPSFLPPTADRARCEEVNGVSICTRPCDPTRPGSSCGSVPSFGGGSTSVGGLYCRRTTGCDGRCVSGEVGRDADGASCDEDTDCASLACVDPGDGRRRCLSPCRAGAGSCPVGEACAARDGCGSCVDAVILREARRLGEPCERDDQCAGDGVCVDDDAGGYCTHACGTDADCAAGYRCESARCARGARGALGDPCAANGDCGAGTFCVNAEGRRWCSAFCDEEAGCPDGLSCTSASEASVCAPNGGLLGETCASDADCAFGSCESGVCARACGAEDACPVGFFCERGAEGAARCVRPAPLGGCSAAPRGRPPALFVAIALAAVARLRRGRARGKSARGRR